MAENPIIGITQLSRFSKNIREVLSSMHRSSPFSNMHICLESRENGMSSWKPTEGKPGKAKKSVWLLKSSSGDSTSDIEAILKALKGPKVQVQKYRSKWTIPKVQVQIKRSKWTSLNVQVQRLRSKWIDPKVQVQQYRSKGTGPKG